VVCGWSDVKANGFFTTSYSERNRAVGVDVSTLRGLSVGENQRDGARLRKALERITVE
jgi:hypothetical protein